MSNMANQLSANIFKALAHPTRIQIIKLLKDGELCVCKILPKISSEQSNTSQHLAILKNQGIVECEKIGSMVYYRLKSPEVLTMFELAEGIIMKQIEKTKSAMSK